MTMVTTPMPSRTAVSNSCTLKRNPPSPWMATTGASGLPSFAPSASGKAKPSPPKSSGVMRVPD